MALHLLVVIMAAALCSYGGVVIFRYREGISVLSPRSFCDSCRTPLPFRALVPLAGPLFVRFRCTSCEKRVPIRYTGLELAGTLAAVFLLLRGIAPLTALHFWIFGWALLVSAVTDMTSGIVPLTVILPAAAAGILFRAAGIQGPEPVAVLAGAAGGWCFFFLIRLASKGGSGLGDADFAAYLGLFLGWQSLIAALITAFLAGGLWAGTMLLSGKARKGMRVPFTPFLAGGAIVVLFAGNWVFRLYGWPV